MSSPLFENWLRTSYPQRFESHSWNGDTDGSIAFGRAAFEAGSAQAQCLTEPEQKVMDALVLAWNKYLELSKDHPDQDAEFRHGIHALQHQLMARPTRRAIKAREVYQ